MQFQQSVFLYTLYYIKIYLTWATLSMSSRTVLRESVTKSVTLYRILSSTRAIIPSATRITPATCRGSHQCHIRCIHSLSYACEVIPLDKRYKHVKLYIINEEDIFPKICALSLNAGHTIILNCHF